MSETVKLIIEIPKDTAREIKDNAMFAESIASQIKWDVTSAIVNGIPLDSNSERAEVQAYFAGQTYGWEEGRKALIDDVKAEIKGWYWQADKQALAKDPCVVDAMVDLFIRTLDKHIGKGE